MNNCKYRNLFLSLQNKIKYYNLNNRPLESRIYTLAEVSDMMHNDYPAGASVIVAQVDSSVLKKVKKGQICVNFYTLVLVQRGGMSYALKGNLIELKANDLVLVPPNYPVS